MFTPGQIVRFINPNADEVGIAYRVVELRGPRVLIKALVNMPFPPSQTVPLTEIENYTMNHEFPDFDYELPVIEGFIDSSWHNDICPSLTREPTAKVGPLILWCDYADRAQRERGPEGSRYTLVEGYYAETDEQIELCESEDLADILAAIAARDNA